MFSQWSRPDNYYATPDVLVALQVSYLMSTGRSVWIQAMLYILLGGGFVFQGILGLMHTSPTRANRLPNAFKYHSYFAFIVAALGFAGTREIVWVCVRACGHVN